MHTLVTGADGLIGAEAVRLLSFEAGLEDAARRRSAIRKGTMTK